MPGDNTDNIFSRYSGYLFVFLAAALWAILGPLSRVSLQNGVSPVEVAFWRACLGGVFFIAHGIIGKHYKIPLKAMAAFALFGVIGVAFLFYIYIVAVERGGAALAAVLLYTAPAWVAIFSRLFFHESLTPLKLISIALAFAGTVLFCLGGGGSLDKVGVICGLLSGLCYAMHYVFCGLYLSRYSAVSLYMYCLPIGAALLFPLVSFSPKGAEDWLVMLALGLGCTYGAYYAYCEGMKRISPTRVAVLANLEPMLAAVFAYIFWDEFFTAAGWAGAALILGAVFLVVFDGSKNSAPEA